jgi:ABC-type dipeptide/oligopeptide/nickel transport system permease subunit
VPPVDVPGAVAPADVEAQQGLIVTMSPKRLAWKRYWGHSGAAVSTVILAFVLFMVLATPITARYGIDEPVIKVGEGDNVFLSPRAVAWFGTDSIGRDMYTRLLYGIRTSMFIGIASAILSVMIGTVVGSLAGLRGGRFDDALMRVTDLFLAFPFLILVILVREFLGAISFLEPIIGNKSSIRFIIVLFAVFGWMGVARLVRGQVLALKEREFIEASRAAGASNFRIIKSHLLPNSVGPILVALTLSVIAAVVGEATLSFFGFGPQPGQNSTSLGLLIQLARDGVQRGDWFIAVFPCGALVLLAICINFIGDGLRDALDPKLDSGR